MSDERRHQMEEKTYAVLTADSINTMAESSGLSPIPYEAAVTLGEDTSYRLRQVVMLATQYMKHSKRRRLSVDDFNRAAKELNLMPVLGHGSQESMPFRHVKDSDIHCVDDPEVNLCDIALGNYVPKSIGQPSIKAHWLAVEGVIKISSGVSASFQGKGSREMSKVQLEYYTCVTKALLGAKPEPKKKALQDLKTNPNIVSVLPYLINFVVNGIKNMSHDIGHLTTMLNTVRALLHNRSLYLLHKPYLTHIVQGVEFCVLEPLVAASISSVHDHWVLRDYAARLLGEIVNRWNSPQNHLRFNTLKCLREVLQDRARPFYSHYGAVMTLIALGHAAIEDVILPYLPTYWPHLIAAMEDATPENVVIKSDSLKVHGALRLAAEKVLRKHIIIFQRMCAGGCGDAAQPEVNDVQKGRPAVKKGTDKSIHELYSMLYEYFGDSLSSCLPLMDTSAIFKPVEKDEIVNLGDENSGKSGAELLDNLMEQIYLQEKLEEERQEQERLERLERDKRERERLVQEAIRRKERETEETLKRKREEEEHRRKRLEMEEAERQKRLKEEESRRQRAWEEQILELNKNRSKSQWQQEIELRRMQLEEEMQYSRMLEAKKRQEGRDKARAEEEEKLKRQKEEEEEMRMKEEEDEQSGRSRVGLRRRKPVNYTEKDEDISDLFEDPRAVRRPLPRLNPALPPHSDISEDSEDESKKLAGSPAEGIAVSKVIDSSKGLLKLKIKRQSTHSSTPPHTLSATPQHTPLSYHSPSMQSPMYSPLYSSHSTPPPPHASSHHRSKSSSGSEKESKQKKSSGSSGGGAKQFRGGSLSLNDNSDVEEPFSEIPHSSVPLYEPTLSNAVPLYEQSHGSVPPLMYSPGAESSGSDSNPHRKALKLKLKLTVKESASD